MKIFINYRRKDSSGYALALQTKLSQVFGKDSIFIDVEGLVAGQDFEKTIQEFLLNCDVVICIIGEDWIHIKDSQRKKRLDNPKDFVRLEIELALENGIPIIPVLLNSTQMPTESDLPEKMRALSKIQALEISDKRFERDADYLITVTSQYIKDKKNVAVIQHVNDLLSKYPEFTDLFKSKTSEQTN